jgi:tetratricopeptide (TPR) repeat protein
MVRINTNDVSFWGVFWVDVSSTSTVQTDFIAVAKAIGSSAESIDEARQILANRSETWLLILDNADDAGVDYQIYFPSGTRGSIILTSRIPECSQYNTVGSKALTGLSDQDSIELLLKATQIHPPSWPTHEPAAKQVIEILGSHTLALIQAGAYVAMGYCQLEQYPGEYDRRRARLLKFAPKQAQSRYGDVYATFEVSAHILESSKGTVASDALDLLGILSMLHHRDVPVQLFEDAWERSQHISDYENEGLNHLEILTKHHVSTLPDFVNEQGARWDGFRLKDAIRLLASLALISVDCGFLSMHLLTHAWSADRQSLDQQVKTWNSTGWVLAFSGFWYDTWRVYEKQFRLHIRHHLDRGMEGLYNSKQNDATAMIPVLFHCIWSLSAMGDDSKVGEVLDWFFEELNLDSDVPSIPWLPLYILRGESLFHLRKVVQTIKLLEPVMEVITATLAETHRDRLRSQRLLAAAYSKNGQNKQAIELLKQVVDITAATLAENNPDRLASQYELAVAYRKNGQNEQAIELLKQVVGITAATSAENHPNRLVSQYELAVAYRKNGQNEQVIELLKQVVGIRAATSAENHPNRLASQHALAVAYRENGQSKEAVELMEQVVRLQDNPSRLLVLQRELARAYQANGQIEKAKDLLQASSRT